MTDLMQKIEQIDIKIRYGEEDQEELKMEIRHNRNESFDENSIMAGSTEERFQQIAEKIEQTDKERAKLIRKDMKEVRNLYESVNIKLWSL